MFKLIHLEGAAVYHVEDRCMAASPGFFVTVAEIGQLVSAFEHPEETWLRPGIVVGKQKFM